MNYLIKEPRPWMFLELHQEFPKLRSEDDGIVPAEKKTKHML